MSGARRFVAASYESVLSGLGVPTSARMMAEPNEAIVVDARNGWRLLQRFPLVEWDLRQFKTDTCDWMAAFQQAVRVRSTGIKHGAFIGFSSGYDSGAIMLALQQQGTPFTAYSVPGHEDLDILAQRRAFCRGVAEPVNISGLESRNMAYETNLSWLNKHMEPFRCATTPCAHAHMLITVGLDAVQACATSLNTAQGRAVLS